MRTTGTSLPNGSESMRTEIARIGQPVMGTGSKQMLLILFFEQVKIIGELKLVEKSRLIIYVREITRIRMVPVLIGK